MDLHEKLKAEAGRSVGDLRETLHDAMAALRNHERDRAYASDLIVGVMRKLNSADNEIMAMQSADLSTMLIAIAHQINEKAQISHRRPVNHGGDCALAASAAWVVEVADFLELCHYVPGYITRPLALNTASRLFGGRHG